VVAHELSQPLLGIKAFAQILRRRYTGDAFIEPKVKLIEDQAIHMEGILDSLRQHSKPPRPSSVRIDPLVPVQSAIDLFQDRARKVRVKIAVEVKGEKLPLVLTSQGHLQQVVVNLISNGLDELDGKGGGTILVTAEAVEDGVRLRVADTGPGVPAEFVGRLFESFFTTKGVEKGTGLGLSICREILESYGGSIRLMTPDETHQALGNEYGAAFEVLLRRAPQE
jgi:signal transduction histidine kinase